MKRLPKSYGIQKYTEGIELVESTDVIVIGGGNAGFSAVHAARERGRRVVLLERGSESLAGGNSFYTAGATRIVHGGLEDLADIIDDDPRHARTVVPSYSRDEYLRDLSKVTQGRNDPTLSEVLVSQITSTVRWLAAKGVRYRLMYERQAYLRPDDSYLFWGGLHIGNTGGGVGLIDDHTRIAHESGADVRYGAHVTELMSDGGRVVGVRYARDGETVELRADSVIIAAGGFEANADLRREYLGEGWEHAKVRGTPYNLGELLQAAVALGAGRAGDWSTCHSVAWDARATDNESNRQLTNRLTRQSYPIGILVNRNGKRFVDEGADFRNYTYAKYGKDILVQPDSIAFQIFDSQTRPMLREEEYEMPGVSVEEADSLEVLADRAGIDRDGFVATVREFNAAIRTSADFDPTVKDGRSAHVVPPKSNWALAIERAPFYAYPVTCGITFTFGGLKTDTDGRVLRPDHRSIPGLFAVGEALGGLFSGNYPGGTGLAAGMVFGRRAGSVA
jgi:tricarballylate dehydrogenase